MANDQQFCLRWNNHQSTLISVFDSLLENETLVDCTLAAEGQSLKAHKVVLSACSPYLESLLSKHYEKHPILILKDVKFTELKSMMDYMYRGEVNICQDQLGTFLKAAESLQIKGLSDNGDEAVGTSSAAPKKDPPRPSVTQTTRTPVESKRPAPPGDSSDASRDGSISPSSLRKRRRTRRPSQGDEVNHLDSNCDTAQTAPIVPAVTVPAPVKQIVKQEPNLSINETGLKKEIIEPPNEPLLEPKTEYLDYMNNENSIEVEDLTLDDDDDLDSSMDASRPGPSHGDMSNQGYPAWPMGDQSGTDEIFMAAQEAVGAATGQQQRDSQGLEKSDAQQSLTPQIPMAPSREVEITQVIAVSDPAQLSVTMSTSTPLDTVATVSAPLQVPLSTPIHDLVLQDQSGNVLKVLKIYSSSVVEDKKKGEKEVEKLLGASEIESLTASIASIASRDELFEVQIGSSHQEVQTNATIAPGLFEFRQVVDCGMEKAQVVEEAVAVSQEEESNEEAVLSDPMPAVEKEIIFNKELDKFQCQRCLKAYRNKSGVINHLLNHCHGTSAPKLFSCDFCPYTAQMAVTLRVHLARNHKVTGVGLNRSNICKNFGIVAGEIKFPKALSKKSASKNPATVKEDTDVVDNVTSDPDFKLPVTRRKGKPKSGSETARPKRAKRHSSKISDEAEEQTTLIRMTSVTPPPSTSSAQGNSQEGTSSEKESSNEPYENEFDFDEETSKYKCKSCKKAYKLKTHVLEHKYTDCRNKNIHECLFCPYKGRTPTNVRVHIGHKHGKWPRLDENGVWIY